MKQVIYSFLMLLSCVMVESCEEDDAQLMFTIELCTPPTDVQMDYFSPDPMHMPRMYWITANKNASELLIKCINASNISITSLSDALPNDFDPEVELDGLVDGDTYTSRNGCWSVTLVDGNTLKFVFDEVRESNHHYSYGFVGSSLAVNATTPKSSLWTHIDILRLIDYSDPLNQ